MTNEAFSAKKLSLEEIIQNGERFLIPLYQRLYVWKQEQVQRLMDDIIAALCQAKSKGRKDEAYYLGGILAIRREQVPGVEELELIDGQQRLTTLWLLALAWSDAPGVARLADFIGVGEGEKRFRFAVREGANHFVETALGGEPEGCQETRAMEEALQVLKGYPDSATEFGPHRPERAELAQFILNNVRLALTEVPADTDLNKLFEVINNRGEQLQHQDILKKRLLEEIDYSEQEAHARMWDACSAMDDYLERNFARVQGESIRETVSRWYTQGSGKSISEVNVVFHALSGVKDQTPGDPLSLDQILEISEEGGDSPERGLPDGDDDGPSIESIISFPMLLQHTLRIFNQERGRPDIDHVNDKDLLDIFDSRFFPVNEGDAEVFIQKLWQVRATFDNYVVKWIGREEGDKRLHVRQIRQNEDSYPRSAEGVPRGLSLLQAVIYHSQGKTTQYWLSPFLDFCLKEPDLEEAWEYLRYLEHCLFTVPSEQNLRERSRRFMEELMPEAVETDMPGALQKSKGNDFRHYWFYKTEYLLWENRKENEEELPEEFRIVSRNSVEHILPQKSLERDNEAGDWLHAFANLALVNREMNSRFSNDIFTQKKAKYEQSRRISSSLMLDIVFENNDWNKDLIRHHQVKLEKEWQDYLRRLAERSKSLLASEEIRG